MKLKNIGETGWRGQDFDGAELRADPGQEVEMTDARGEKVLKDYPARFVRVDVEVTRDPADTSASGSSVPVVTVSAGTDDAPGSVFPVAPTAPEPPPAAPHRRRRRRGPQP